MKMKQPKERPREEWRKRNGQKYNNWNGEKRKKKKRKKKKNYLMEKSIQGNVSIWIA